MSRAETGEDAEGKVKGSDDGSGREAHGTGRDVKVGDEPEGTRCEGRGDSGDEGFEIGLGKTVEKEVGHDEIVGTGWSEGEGIGVVCVEASGAGLATLAEETEHRSAGVYRIGVKMSIDCKELGEEASISVTENQGSVLLEEMGEEVKATTFQGAPEGEVFEPAVRAGYEVEIGFRSHQCLICGGMG